MFNLQFINPFSDEFLKLKPSNDEIRSVEAARNSYGRGEDTIEWDRLVNGYNNGYHYGYQNGKSDEREKWERAIVATALISFGVIIIYNAVTNSNEKPRDVTHYNYRF